MIVGGIMSFAELQLVNGYGTRWIQQHSGNTTTV